MHRQDTGDTFHWVTEERVIKVLFIKVKAGCRETSKNWCWTWQGAVVSRSLRGEERE